MTFDQFRTALDGRIRDDTTDKSRPDFSTTRQCKKTGDTYTCTFNDRGFQSTVAGFKKLDIMNGRFTLKLALTIKTENGKIASIRLNGDRSDPANMMTFIGTATNVMQTFDPHITDAEGSSLALAKEMGLMRGDSAPDVGTSVVTIKPYAAVRCLIVPSEVTTAEACEWVPRS